VDQNLNQEPEKQVQQDVQQLLPPEKKPGKIALQVFAVIVLLALVGTGIYAWQNNRVAQLEQEVTELKNDSAADSKTKDPYAGWKTYTSNTEKSSFKYPADWKLVTTDQSNYGDQGADSIELRSPDGQVKVTWISALDGLGGACEPQECPYINVLEKQSIKAVPGASLIRGTYSIDNKVYVPFLGLTSTARLNAESAYRGLLFMVFDGINNNLGNPSPVGVTLSTVGITPGNEDGYSMTKAQAESFFSNNTEAKQARLIVESYSY
jgi:hypothetical protein